MQRMPSLLAPMPLKSSSLRVGLHLFCVRSLLTPDPYDDVANCLSD